MQRKVIAEHTFKGWLKIDDYGEGMDILILDDEPLAMKFNDEYLTEKYLSVSYYICSKEKTPSEAERNFVNKICGACECDYGDAYSDYTGYLWTDEELEVGGHNLIEELTSYDGKYCILIVKEFEEEK